jgi:hypothetical protein
MPTRCIQDEMVCLHSEWRRGKGGRLSFDVPAEKVDRDLPRNPSDSSVSRRMIMNTRGAAMAANDDGLQKAGPDARRSVPQAGDILASERSARADVFAISIIPTDSDVTVRRYSAAIERVQELARTRRVDAWYTSDHTHYARVASYRSR